jgi:hypothetical protein
MCLSIFFLLSFFFFLSTPLFTIPPHLPRPLPKPPSQEYKIKFSTTGGDPPNGCRYAGTSTKVPCIRTLRVTDTQPPRITLQGPKRVILEGGDPFNDPGATAFDDGEAAVN